MDGLGYRNWSSGVRDSYDDSQESSPPTYASEQYGFKNKSSKDEYDFELSQDMDSPIPKPKQTRTRTREVKRKSQDERISEILEKAKASKPVSKPKDDSVDDADEIYNSWKSSYNQLMEGLDISSPKLTETNESPLVIPRGKHFSPLNQSDSFDISEADLEVHQKVIEESHLNSCCRLARLLQEEVKKKQWKDIVVTLYRLRCVIHHHVDAAIAQRIQWLIQRQITTSAIN